jgi:CheY-specific phosphatase CheX
MLLIETKKQTAMNFAKSLTDISGQDYSINDIVKSYIGEIGNIILNKTVPLLNKTFGDSHLSTPSVFVGANIQVNLFYKISYDVVVCTQFGEFKFTFAIKE